MQMKDMLESYTGEMAVNMTESVTSRSIADPWTLPAAINPFPLKYKVLSNGSCSNEADFEMLIASTLAVRNWISNDQ